MVFRIDWIRLNPVHEGVGFMASNHDQSVVAQFKGKTAGELAKAPVWAIHGISEEDAGLLKKAFNIDSVADLALHPLIHAAQDIFKSHEHNNKGKSGDLGTIDLNQVHLNAALTETLAYACYASYKDFKGVLPKAPRGYEFVSRFTGWDEFIGSDGTCEKYGLIYRSTTEAGVALVAFRGTVTKADWFEDFRGNTAIFTPVNPNVSFPSGVEVEAGFYSVYTDKGGDMKSGMRAQVFQQLAAMTDLKKVYVTGHSLGASLATLFALDLAVSRPDLEVSSSTFASPRVGKAAWKQVYESTPGLEENTFRIFNTKDVVPMLPPNAELDYVHVGQPFRVDFHRVQDWIPHIGSRHSLENYRIVLGNALASADQVWEGNFPDAEKKGALMQSDIPSMASDADT